jgi:hypothetical protein
MKLRNITLLFVIGSLFLLFACSHALTGGTAKTVRLNVPNLPSGG